MIRWLKRMLHLPGEIDLHWSCIEQLEQRQEQHWQQLIIEQKHLRERITELEKQNLGLKERLDKQSEIARRDADSLNKAVLHLRDGAQVLNSHGDKLDEYHTLLSEHGARLRNIEKRIDPPAVLSDGGRLA